MENDTPWKTEDGSMFPSLSSSSLGKLYFVILPSVSELEASVDKLQKEVEQLREQRNQQKQLADSSARQRDMYKALLTQSTGFSLPLQGNCKILPHVEIFLFWIELNFQCNDVKDEVHFMCMCLKVQIPHHSLQMSGPRSQLLALLPRELRLLSRHRLPRQKQL